MKYKIGIFYFDETSEVFSFNILDSMDTNEGFSMKSES